MIEVRDASPGEAESWFDGWSERLQEWFGAFSDEPEWVSHSVELRTSRWKSATDKLLFTLTDGGEQVGHVAIRVVESPPEVALIDLWIAPEHRRRGFGRAAVEWLEIWAVGRGDRLVMSTRKGDPAQEALFGKFSVGAQHMVKTLEPRLAWVIGGATGRSMTEAEFDGWREKQIVDYAAEIAGSGLMTEAEAMERAVAQIGELLAEGLATPNQSFVCLEADGEVVATNWLAHGYAPRTSFVYGVDVVDGYRGKGYGKSAMVLGEQVSLEAGDAQLGLNVFGQNAVATGLYDSLGYRTVEVHRSLVLGS